MFGATALGRASRWDRAYIPLQNALDLLQRLQFVAEFRDLAIDAGQSPDIALTACSSSGCLPHAYSLEPPGTFCPIDNVAQYVWYNKT
jgi:hypothetical protein